MWGIRTAFEVPPADAVSAFFRTLPPQRDELAQVAVAIPVHGEANQPQSILQEEFAADQQMQSCFLRFRMRSHHSCHGTFVGDGERGIAKARGALDQFLRHGGSLEEAEAGAAVKFS